MWWADTDFQFARLPCVMFWWLFWLSLWRCYFVYISYSQTYFSSPVIFNLIKLFSPSACCKRHAQMFSPFLFVQPGVVME